MLFRSRRSGPIAPGPRRRQPRRGRPGSARRRRGPCAGGKTVSDGASSDDLARSVAACNPPSSQPGLKLLTRREVFVKRFPGRSICSRTSLGSKTHWMSQCPFFLVFRKTDISAPYRPIETKTVFTNPSRSADTPVLQRRLLRLDLCSRLPRGRPGRAHPARPHGEPLDRSDRNSGNS